MTPVRRNGEITYDYATDKGITVLSRKSVLHIKGFGTDGVVGLSPLAYARQTLGVTVSADTFASKSFANGGRPGGVLALDRFLEPKQRELVRELYSNMSATALNAGKLWVLEGGMKYESINIPPDDMQMLQTRQFQLGEIARIFRVPSHLINDTEKSTSWGSGIEQLNLGFLQYTLRPYLTRWESVIRDALLTPVERESVVVEHNVEGLLRADSAARANFYAQMAQNGLMTRNEIRRKENLPKMEGGDELTAQTNLAPLDKLGVPAMAPAPAPIPEDDEEDETPKFVINMPESRAASPNVNVSVDSPQPSERKRGTITREVVEWDERGVPKKVIEREILVDSVVKEVTAYDEYGVPKMVVERQLGAGEHYG